MKLKKTIYSKRKGAVFVSWSTGFRGCRAWPAKWGIIKLNGCVFFLSAEPDHRNDSEVLESSESRKKYGDHPSEEEAWLVYPIDDPDYEYKWERVDTKLVLSWSY